MAFSKELMKLIGNEIVSTAPKAGGKAVLQTVLPTVAGKVGADLATKEATNNLSKILVNKIASDTSSYVPVVVNGKVALEGLPGYSTGNSLSLRHISGKGDASELGVSRTGRQHEGVLFANKKGSKIPVVKGDNVYFGSLDNANVVDITDPDTALALSKGYGYNLKKVGAFSDSADPSSEIANQVAQIRAGRTGSINKGSILNDLTGGNAVIKGRSDVLTETAPEYVLTNDDMVKRANFKLGYNRNVSPAIKEAGKYLPAKPGAGLDEYGMGTISLRDLNTPKIQQSVYDYGYGGSRGGFSADVKSIGTKDVAPIDPNTLPEGYDFYRKVSEKNKAKYGWVYDAVSKETGKPARRITNSDLRKYLEDYYPDYLEDGKMTKYDLERQIQSAMEDEITDEAWENGADLSMLVHNRYPRAGIRDIYNDHSGKTGMMDRELSKRLGIGESTSVMSDVPLNDTGRNAGDAAGNMMGIKFDDWASDEDRVGVVGHERLHLFQHASKRNDFNYEKVKPVYNKLHEDLKDALLDEEAIRKAHPGSQFDRMGGMSYWGSDIEQEARMLEAYLYDRGFVKGRPYRVDEFADKMSVIRPAFDKFFKSLRELSKKGVALPAIGALFGIGALSSEDKKS